MLALLRPLSRMVKDAARVETPAIRVFDARYGYLLKYNIPVSRGSQNPSPAPPAKQNPPPLPVPSKGGHVPKPPRNAPGRSPRRGPDHGSTRRNTRRRRSRIPPVRRPNLTSTAPDKAVYEERPNAWQAGADSKGSLRDMRKNCYMGHGTHAPRHVKIASGPRRPLPPRLPCARLRTPTRVPLGTGLSKQKPAARSS